MSEDKDEEKRGLGERLLRYAKVTGAVGGIAARLAGEKYLGLSTDRTKHAELLKTALGEIKGPLMKVAQLLSSVPDALPEEYVLELGQLQSSAPAMGWPFVKRRMMNELGADWLSKFRYFDQQASAAASLGQVHKATLVDGTLAACKLQYPDMQSVVDADLAQLKFVFSLYERMDATIKTEELFDELQARLYEELDYRREAKHITLYQRMLEGETGVHVPMVFPDLSTDRLLTMSWMEGAPLKSIIADDQEFRNTVALNMFRAWYKPFYTYGIIHGDPHLGNYSIRPDGSINLLDFGCVRIFDPLFVKGVIDLYFALLEDDRDRAISAYEAWGFTNLSSDVIDILNTWARFIYGPILENKSRAIRDDHEEGFYGKSIATKVYDELRKKGGITPPRTFFFMDRAAIGLGSVFMHLQANINWYKLFHELIGDFDVEALRTKQREVLEISGLL